MPADACLCRLHPSGLHFAGDKFSRNGVKAKQNYKIKSICYKTSPRAAGEFDLHFAIK